MPEICLDCNDPDSCVGLKEHPKIHGDADVPTPPNSCWHMTKVRFTDWKTRQREEILIVMLL